jgi:hypothetical protein
MNQIHDELDYCTDQTQALDSLFRRTQVTGIHDSSRKVLPPMNTEAPWLIAKAVQNIGMIDAIAVNEKMDESAAEEEHTEASTAGGTLQMLNFQDCRK